MDKLKSSGSTAVAKPLKEEQKEEEAEGEIIRFVVRQRKNVNFQVGTIDNEGMGKRKSKGK